MAPHDMFADDKAAELLGISIIETTQGRAVLSLTVREDMVNGLGVCHGGILFTLADAAMAYASNQTIKGEHHSVATSATIDFLAPATVGQILTATAVETGAAGRSRIHDADIVADDNTLIASFRGRTLAVPAR